MSQAGRLSPVRECELSSFSYSYRINGSAVAVIVTVCVLVAVGVQTTALPPLLTLKRLAAGAGQLRFLGRNIQVNLCFQICEDNAMNQLEHINPECVNMLDEIRAMPGTDDLARQIEDYDFETANARRIKEEMGVIYE